MKYLKPFLEKKHDIDWGEDWEEDDGDVLLGRKVFNMYYDPEQDNGMLYINMGKVVKEDDYHIFIDLIDDNGDTVFRNLRYPKNTLNNTIDNNELLIVLNNNEDYTNYLDIINKLIQETFPEIGEFEEDMIGCKYNGAWL